MPYYQAIKQAPAWKDFDKTKGVLSNQLKDIAASTTVHASIVGTQTSTGDTVLSVNTSLFVKLKFFKVVPEPDDSTDPPQPPPVTGDLWQLFPSSGDGEPNPRAVAQDLGSAPDIVVLQGVGERTQLTKAWQSYLVALNPNMRLNNIAGLLGSNKAFTNNTGFPTEARPQRRANWITVEDTEYENPSFDKVRSCALNCHQGVEADGRVTFVTLNGNEPPPSIMAVNPQAHPWLFFHATLVYRDGVIGAFPKGAPAWEYDRNVVLLPLVSNYTVSLPVSRVRRVDSYRLPYTR